MKPIIILIVGIAFLVIGILAIKYLKRKKCTWRACGFYENGYCSNTQKGLNNKTTPCEEFVDAYM